MCIYLYISVDSKAFFTVLNIQSDNFLIAVLSVNQTYHSHAEQHQQLVMLGMTDTRAMALQFLVLAP